MIACPKCGGTEFSGTVWDENLGTALLYADGADWGETVDWSNFDVNETRGRIVRGPIECAECKHKLHTDDIETFARLAVDVDIPTEVMNEIAEKYPNGFDQSQHGRPGYAAEAYKLLDSLAKKCLTYKAQTTNKP